MTRQSGATQPQETPRFRNFTLARLAGVMAATSALACTGIILTASNGDVVYGRTQEWGAFDLKSRVMIVPTGIELTSTMPDGAPGLQWTSRFGVVAIDAVEQPVIIDGLNTEGLATGLLYHPDFAEYAPFDPAARDRALAPIDVATYLLTNFASVPEVRAGMADIDVVDVAMDVLGFAPPIYLMVTDSTGERIVIEFLGGETTIFDAPLGVMTNAPEYDWHLTNLRNYVNLSPVAVEPRAVGELDLTPLGVGSGMIGLPGDFTPPSRFVRAVAFTQSGRETVDGPDAVTELFRVLDNFNVPLPALGDPEAAGIEGMVSATQWTTALDVTNRRFHYHSAHNRRVRQIDLTTLDFDSLDGIAFLPLNSVAGQDMEILSLP